MERAAQLEMIAGKAIVGDGPTPRMYVERPHARVPYGWTWHVRWTRTDPATWSRMRRFLAANAGLFDESPLGEPRPVE